MGASVRWQAYKGHWSDSIRRARDSNEADPLTSSLAEDCGLSTM